MKLHQIPILKEQFEKIQEPYYFDTFPSRFTDYRMGDNILFEEVEWGDNVVHCTGRMVLTVIYRAIRDGGCTHCKCKVLLYLNNTYVADFE